MSKATIIEAQNSNTVYEEGKTKGILGKLKGIFADYKNGTRNADRLYTEELWDNRVFGSEDVMEALETKTLFGELDHPEGDRCETLAQNAAITITKLEKNPEEGVIYGEAEILDTPTGRIVKALADSGAKLGISSRGMGEEIMSEGRNIIDPETYDFITFDVVVTPANTKARVALTESKHLNKLTESLEKEVKECETENQLNQIKTVLENVNTTNKEELMKEVETKLEGLKPQVKVSSKLTEANRQIALNLIQEKYMESKNTLEETAKATEQLSQENAKLVEQNEFLTNSRNMLKEQLKAKIDCIEKGNLLEQQKWTEFENKIKAVEAKGENNTRTLTANYETKIKELNETIEKLNKEKEQLNEKYSKLSETNQKLAKTVDNDSKIILEGKKQQEALQQKVKMLENEKVASSKKLIESKKLQDTRIRTLENKIATLEETNSRYEKLSFNPSVTVKATTENFGTSDNYSDEDKQLFEVLTNG